MYVCRRIACTTHIVGRVRADKYASEEMCGGRFVSTIIMIRVRRVRAHQAYPNDPRRACPEGVVRSRFRLLHAYFRAWPVRTNVNGTAYVCMTRACITSNGHGY